MIGRKKKAITTYFKKSTIESVDEFCKENNIKRTEFLEMACLSFINSVDGNFNLLSLAFYSPSDENWLQNKIHDFLSDLWDIYSQDFEEIFNQVIAEENLECHEYYNMIETYGFETIVKILIKCVIAENNLNLKRNCLK